MPPHPTARTPTVYTIGHSNHELEHFLNLLRQHGVQLVIDTRSSPYSRYSSQFNDLELARALKAIGVEYLFLGRQLGGRPADDRFYDEDGHVLYSRVADSPAFCQGIEQVERIAPTQRAALLCSEENPAICHRHLLVSRVLSQRGAEVLHIRGDGAVQTYEQVVSEAARSKDHGQQMLFSVEEDSWKSIRSVSPKKPLPSSLES